MRPRHLLAASLILASPHLRAQEIALEPTPATATAEALAAPAVVPPAAPASPSPSADTGIATGTAAPIFPPPNPLEVSIRRALPVDEPPPPPDTRSLSRTLPPGHKSVYTRCETDQPILAITFDDGPDPVHTPRLLDILKERGIHATFFMVGRNVSAFPAIVKRMAAEGHEVANHSWSHPLLTSMGQKSVESQIQRTHDAIIKACGIAPLLYRPPYGAIGLAQRARIEKTFGYSAILWDVDPLDWQKPRSAQKVYDRILTKARPGSIILCHDIHETTVAAMPAVLDDLKKRGYAFATVTQLIAYTTPPPPPAAAAAADGIAPASSPAPSGQNPGAAAAATEAPTGTGSATSTTAQPGAETLPQLPLDSAPLSPAPAKE